MAIHQNLSYYAGYYLEGIEGNIDVLGSITGEQNHSVNIRIIDKVILMSIVELIFTLFRKNQYIVRNHRKIHDELYGITADSTPDYGGQEGTDDAHAKILLTDYDY